MRAEARDQTEWTERRRRRLRAGGGGTTLPHATGMNSSSGSPKTLKTEECQRHCRRQPKSRAGRKPTVGETTQVKVEEILDPTQAMIRIGQLKSTLTKASDPPAVATELAKLYLVLSDQKGALKSFQLAVKASPGEPSWVARRDPERELLLQNSSSPVPLSSSRLLLKWANGAQCSCGAGNDHVFPSHLYLVCRFCLLYHAFPLFCSEWVPTKEETDKREMQERRLMLLNRDKRTEALAELKAQDAEKERERELAENARRRQAATGIFLCLLELNRPVEAATAAGVRLDMCETQEERRQVMQQGVGFSLSLASRALVCLSVCCAV